MQSALLSPLTPAVARAEPGLRFTLITSAGALHELRPAWASLLERSPSPEPMLGPDWLHTWWQVYGRGRQLCVGLFHDRDKLVGIAPLQRRRVWYRSLVPFCRLEFLGADVDEQDGVCSEYLSLIAAPGFEAVLARAFVRHVLAGAFGSWDELVLSAMDGSGTMPALLADECHAAGLPARMSTATEAPFISLPDSWDQYLRQLPKKKRYGILKAQRDLLEWSGGHFRFHEALTGAELSAGKAILTRLHGERWPGGGAFAAPRFADFHAAVMPRLLAAGQLQLVWLTVRGASVAVQYHMVVNGKTYFYQCGRAVDLPPQQRPGVVLIAHMIQRAIAAGHREFDFLGGLSRYKMDFARQTRPIVQLRAVRACGREWLRQRLEDAAGWARAVRRRRQKPIS